MLLQSSWIRSLFLGTALLATLPILAMAQAPGGGPEADAMFRNLDANSDGRLTNDDARPNNRAMLTQIFQMAGKEPSATLSRQEFQQVFDRVRGGGSRNAPAGQTTPSETPSEPAKVSDAPLSGLLQQLDANSDGKLVRTEWTRLSQLFSKRDGDKNASLEGAELMGEAEDVDLSQLAKRLDTSGDDKLTRPEWSRLSQLFGQLDTDHNGSLDSAELDAPQPESENVARSGRGSRSNPTNRDGDTGPSVWRGWIVNGRGENPNAGHLEMELTIAGNQMRAREIGAQQRAPQGLGAGTFVMNGDGKSGTLDATQTEGQNQGRVYLGIFQMDGDVLRWCVSNRNGQRPQDMATAAGTYLMVLRRQVAQQ